MKYPKINSIFKRDMEAPGNPFILGEYSCPEFKILSQVKWEATEKIDGTNIRIELTSDEHGVYTVNFKGRSDNAVIPTLLFERLVELFPLRKLVETMITSDRTHPIPPITIFGEGYGMKIQKGGNYIPDGVDFILFDIAVGNYWLERETLEIIASKLGINIVPLIGYMTIEEAIAFVKKGFKSTIAANPEYDSEGLVLKAPLGLNNRCGERIITKIKHRDFK